jgi:hypothetical protein
MGGIGSTHGRREQYADKRVDNGQMDLKVEV